MPFTAHHLTELRMALGRSDMTQAECLAEIGRLRKIEKCAVEMVKSYGFDSDEIGAYEELRESVKGSLAKKC